MSKAARNNEQRPFPRKEGPPQQPRTGREDDRQPLGPMFKGQFRFSLWYVFLVFVAMIGFNYLVANRHDPRAIDYGDIGSSNGKETQA